jgi:hypothetical protein
MVRVVVLAQVEVLKNSMVMVSVRMDVVVAGQAGDAETEAREDDDVESSCGSGLPVSIDLACL